MVLSVLQWNVWFREKADNIVAFIQQTDADIVCVQELTQDSTDNPGRDIPAEIAALGYQSAFRPSRIGFGTETIYMGNAVFSKFPILSEREVYVQREDSNSPNRETENRIYVETILQTEAGSLRVGTVHLSFVSKFFVDSKKKIEVDKLLDGITPNQERFILTGDLNSTPDTYTFEALNKVLQHAGPEISQATWTTKPFAYKDFEANTLDWRLDYVFTTPDITVHDSRILQTDYSDHLPILVELEI